VRPDNGFHSLTVHEPSLIASRNFFISAFKNLSIVKSSPGAIGYLELSYAKDAGLPVAAIENRAGEFVTPSPASATLAINAYEQALSQDLRTPVVDPPAWRSGDARTG
jgi:ABC-type phosphate transport system substrate-binding protein